MHFLFVIQLYSVVHFRCSHALWQNVHTAIFFGIVNLERLLRFRGILILKYLLGVIRDTGSIFNNIIHHYQNDLSFIAYGPIQHSNGLCINVKDDNRTLIWSRDCSSENAFFLVSYHYPPYHVATGKCVLPMTYVV